MELRLWSPDNPDWVEHILPMAPAADSVWQVESELLVPGAVYSVHADGPNDHHSVFNPQLPLVDPYARGVITTSRGEYRNVIVDADGDYDWQGTEHPRIPLRDTVIYEAHVKGLTAAHPDIPVELRGTYAGLAHPAMISYLKNLGITSVELLPVHFSTSDARLDALGLPNYWGYSTLNFFTPHPDYATRQHRQAGAAAVLTEFRDMVRELHRAGLEVILDVVYNHTSEGGFEIEPVSFRGIDNTTYYRHSDEGEYVDTTGCGNTVDTSQPVVQDLILESLRYWITECGIDGFRFDLMATLGRDAKHEFDPTHPLLQAMLSDPVISASKLIAEPWDTGIGGWQVGKFPTGYLEWNDHFRDRVRSFWLRDIAETRTWTVAPQGVADLSAALSGSTAIFGEKRTPLASVNFITAHDGFTLADLVSYNEKHNEANLEDNRDGTTNNLSFNFGIEGPTDDDAITLHRRRAMRSLLGTLFVSAGVPMLTAGDELGRTQVGNNNTYCHDNERNWVNWNLAEWQLSHLESTRRLIQIRRENPALRNVTAARPTIRRNLENIIEEAGIEHHVSQMDWFDARGLPLSLDDWESSLTRTLQYFVSTPEADGPRNRILVLVHGMEASHEVVLPRRPDVSSYTLLWDSSHAHLREQRVLGAGTTHVVGPTSISIYRID
jgi:glycogen operon protein